MNREIREYISELKYLSLTGRTFDGARVIEKIEKILDNSVIIPKDNLQFKFTEHVGPVGYFDSLRCQILGPTGVLTYDMRDEDIKENREEFIKYAKEQLKNKLIDDWSVSKDE